MRPSLAANNDPHPRAPGALALSLMRGRGILEMDREREKEGLKRQRASYAKALKKGRADQGVTLGGASRFVERIWLRRFLA